MIEKKDIFKMVRHIVRQDNGVPDTRIMHPMREWLTGLGGVIILVLGGSVFAASVYQSYTLSTAAEVAIPERVVPYNGTLIEQALEMYLKKQVIYDGLVGTSEMILPTTQSATTTSPLVQTDIATTSLKTLIPSVDTSDAENNSDENVISNLAI